MRTAVVALCVLMGSLPALAETTDPFARVEPDLFLAKAREAGQPAVVLFNIDPESG